MDRELATLARRFLVRVLPLAAAELRGLRALAQRIPNPELRREALSSMAHKDFHVHGGSILATFLDRAQARQYVRLVAVFETAVDYLDNLCDRVGDSREDDFRALHESLADAIDPAAQLRPYFRYREQDDGGYLNALVVRSQKLFAELPSYAAVAPYVKDVTQRYCELQALKHLASGVREKRCAESFAAQAPDLTWWEGAAACGSTLPTFALAFGALRGCDERGARMLYETYFPYISAFHILLDYFIDQDEDRRYAELNFVACYPGRAAAREGISRIGRAALERARRCDDPSHHIFAVRAMCAFYCSRNKVEEQGLYEDGAAIARAVDVNISRSPLDNVTNAVLQPLLELYNTILK